MNLGCLGWAVWRAGAMRTGSWGISSDGGMLALLSPWSLAEFRGQGVSSSTFSCHFHARVPQLGHGDGRRPLCFPDSQQGPCSLPLCRKGLATQPASSFSFGGHWRRMGFLGLQYSCCRREGPVGPWGEALLAGAGIADHIGSPCHLQEQSLLMDGNPGFQRRYKTGC